jgi:hypothetical protein
VSIEVIRATDERGPHGHIMWECRCSFCGGIAKYRSDWIQRGAVNSCGCSPHVGDDIQGRTFGAWLVVSRSTREAWIEQPGRKDRKAAVDNQEGVASWFWLCRCRCGAERILSASSITAKNRASTQCKKCAANSDQSKAAKILWHQKVEQKHVDTIAGMIGRRIGSMVIVGRAPNRSGVVCVEMRCDCGATMSRRIYTYKNGMRCSRHCQAFLPKIATCPKWGVITRLLPPGLALGTVIRQRPQKSQRRRPENAV